LPIRSGDAQEDGAANEEQKSKQDPERRSATHKVYYFIREADDLRMKKAVEVRRAVPSAPVERPEMDQFECVMNGRGALGTARPTFRPRRMKAVIFCTLCALSRLFILSSILDLPSPIFHPQ